MVDYKPQMCGICFNSIQLFTGYAETGFTDVNGRYYHSGCLGEIVRCNCYLCRFVLRPLIWKVKK